MLTRPWTVSLLVPTVFISLTLISACIAGAFYLNKLQRDVSRVLTENVASTIAAKDLESIIAELVRKLRSKNPRHAALNPELTELNAQVNEQLKKVHSYANTEPEKARFYQVEEGWKKYEEGWVARGEKQDLRKEDADLADLLEQEVLPSCVALRDYNTNQVRESDRENRRIVDRLTWGLLAVGIGAPLGGLLLGYAVARRLHHSIYQLSVSIRDAAGRLSNDIHPVTVEGDSDLPAMNRQMRGIIEEIERVVQRLQQREHEVLRAEQLAAVGQVAAGVAHELRNPLTSVKMLVQTGMEGAPPPGLPADDLGIIEHEVRRMEGCIQTFLDFARPPRAERRRTDLLAVVRRALALVEGRIRRQKIVCKVEAPPGPVELCIDAEQIQQVLVNLLLNALDAMPQGGDLRLEVRGPTPDSPQATVRLHDTGPGIAPPIRARLFEPFVSGKETGLGLGLSISRRLTEAHGGAINGENAPKGGAVFTFTLPV